MKLITLLMILGCLHLNAAVFSQTISLSEKNVSLETVFSKMEKQSGYSFFYKSDIIRAMPKVNVEIKNVTVEEALNQFLHRFSLSYLIIDKTVVIKPVTLAFNGIKRTAPTIYVGKVLDEADQPMAGVSVKVKGTSLGTVTSQNGQFISPLILDQKAVLQFSYIGYITQEIKVTELKTPIIIKLKMASSSLDQIQVIGYGTTTKRLNTGSQTTITAKQIENYPVANVLSVLQGTVTGMNVTQASGMPGSTYKVNIRGRNGLSTGSDPLYVIDGVPYIGGSYTVQNYSLGKNAGQGYDALSFINPLDIESINVLKDADATSIYGSRGANGVILITTKKGKAGTTKVDVNVFTGISKVTRIPQFLNTQQYLEMRHEAKRNDKSAILPGDYDLNGTWDSTKYTNWAKELLGGTGHTTNAQVSFSGGNENTQYLLSGNFRKQGNVQQTIGGADQTASLHFNLSSKSADDKFNLNFTGGYTYDLNNIPATDLTGSVAGLPPDAPNLFNPDGTINYQNNTFYNPMSARNQLNNTTINNLMSSLVLSYKFFNGFEFKTNLGYNRQQINEFLGYPTTTYAPVLQVTTGSSYFTNDNNSSWSIEPQLNYHQKINKGQLSAALGSSLQKQITESSPLLATGYSSDLLLKSITAGTTISAVQGIPYDYEKYKFSALFGRLNYNWEDKYILNLNGRYDGSSKFGADRQFHLFGSAGAAWIFTKEKFIADALPFISFGKLRASYGVTGNDQIGNNRYLESYNASTFPYQGMPGLYPSGLPNPELSWESTTKTEAALELQFLKGRISLETNYYRNRTSNILTNNPLSSVTGFTSITQNLPARIENKGLEFTLSATNIQTKSFTWSSTLLFTRQRNQMKSLPGLSQATLNLLNQPVGILRVYRFAGVSQQTGVYQFYTKDGGLTTNPINGVDDTGLINLNPDFFGSLQNSFTYKGFTLDFLFRYIKQVGLNSFGQNTGLPAGMVATNQLTSVLDRWQKPGDIATVQRYGSSFALFPPLLSASRSDLAYSDASYIRLQNLSFGYRFSQAALQRLHIHGLRLYVQGQNLLTISKYGNYDPENQSSFNMPPLRIFTTGLQITL